jgi:hypothetical protein
MIALRLLKRAIGGRFPVLHDELEFFDGRAQDRPRGHDYRPLDEILQFPNIARPMVRCKHPFKKSISKVCWPTFRSSSAIRPSDQRCLPLPGKAFPGPSRNSRCQRCNTLGFTSNARAASAIHTPCSSRRTAANLNSFVNCLREGTEASCGYHSRLRVDFAASLYPDYAYQSRTIS